DSSAESVLASDDGTSATISTEDAPELVLPREPATKSEGEPNIPDAESAKSSRRNSVQVKPDQPSQDKSTSKESDSSQPVAESPEAWRYRMHQGKWWYLQPTGRWAVWSGDGWSEQPMPGEPGQMQSAAQPMPAAVYSPPRHSPVYSGPRYYYSEFYRPYGGSDSDPYYPLPRPPRKQMTTRGGTRVVPYQGSQNSTVAPSFGPSGAAPSRAIPSNIAPSVAGSTGVRGFASGGGITGR
ncbi:MAG: hypothetical protein SGJ20_16065, partial [Planctomycetota bacterium]|nr:hypothetical protein [Planctomycetota bacterium]